MYYVVKKIKERYYLYRQRSFRLQGKVCTESWYIGPVAGPGGNGSGNRKDKNRSRKPETGRGSTGLCVRIDAERIRLGTDSMQKEYLRTAAAVAKAGVRPDQLPAVRVRYGARVGYRKRGDGYDVTMPRFGRVNKHEVWSNYRKALAAAHLDALERHQPAQAAELAERFGASMAATRKAVSSYIRNSTDRNRQAKALALLWFGTANRLKRIPPQAVGLTEYGRIRDWREDFISVYAHARKCGMRLAVQQAQGSLVIAQADLRRELEQVRAELHAIRTMAEAAIQPVSYALLDPSAFSIAEARANVPHPFRPAAEYETALQEIGRAHV